MKDGKKTYCYVGSCPDDHKFLKGAGSLECVATCSGKIYSEKDSKKTCETTCTSKYYLADTKIVSDETYFQCAASGDCSGKY